MNSKINVIELVNTTAPKHFKEKNWKFQPEYFEYVVSELKDIDVENDLFMECGVFMTGGTTFSYIRDVLPDKVTFYGFDTFEGLPHDWKGSNDYVLMNKGDFIPLHGVPPDTENCKFIKGMVEDTLVPFLETVPNKKIKFLHLDMDLYEPTKFALEVLKHRFTDGTILVFDDFYNYSNWDEFSYKALAEVIDKIPFDLVPIATIGWETGWASVAFQLKEKAAIVERIPEDVTIVTGLWDLGRGELEGWANRDFELYKENFFKLLRSNIPMCVWVPKDLEADVWKIRSPHNTKVYTKETEDFKTWFPFFNEHDAIRTDPEWYNRAGWLSSSPQAKLELYNPMMMTKMFMVNDSAIMNPFNTKYFYWIDGGICSTVSHDTFLDGNVFRNTAKAYDDTIVHITYPYEAATEIHGFEKDAFYRHCGVSSRTKELLISRGGFWGGKISLIHEYNSIYYNILSDTISKGLVGADECLFTIAAYKHPELIERFVISSNGLIYPFFDAMRTPEEVIKQRSLKPLTPRTSKNIIYILGFNSPSQFESVCESINEADTKFFEKSRKILINNSTDNTTYDEYDRLCELYQFEEIHTKNIGICGGRQFVAEHFDMTGADFYMFFEDDMHLNSEKKIGEFCSSGFRKYIPNLYEKLIKIMLKEKFDFLKFSFSEFYGENSVQWSWYNVPQSVRTQIWPEYDKLPEFGLDPNCPKTNFTHINFVDELPYITGEIYYSNWPQIVSREGNKKMFLTTKWDRPYEQTWMSHMFQLVRNKELTSGVLLASPVHHERFDFYEDGLRKES